MSLVIEAAQRNISEGTGGPFAAAVFEMESGKLISLGVNLVLSQGLSILHAEMVAFALAQKKIGSYDLGRYDLPAHELVTSIEPCAMCFGAIPWSGVRRVIAGARDADARSIGFDEGPKMKDWRSELEKTGDCYPMRYQPGSCSAGASELLPAGRNNLQLAGVEIADAPSGSITKGKAFQKFPEKLIPAFFVVLMPFFPE